MSKLGWILGALAGSVVGGVGVSGLMLDQERRSGRPSELTVLGRASAAKLGVEPPDDHHPARPVEQAATHGGHMVLSALGGLAYAAAFDEDAPVLASGLAYGMAFYAAAHIVTGPALGLKAPEWRQDAPTIVRHLAVHAVFGLLIAAGARLGAAAFGDR